VPARYLEHVPRMIRNDAGRDVWVVDGQQISVVGYTATAGWPRPFPDGPATLEDCPLAAYDANARLRLMDELSIWAQVLYPNVAGFGAQKFLQLHDDELKLVCVRAYNDFLRDWASEAPQRLITIMSIPFWDIGAAVAEVERCAPAGHRGILFTGEPQRFGLPTLGDPSWDPLWAAARAAGLPIHFHIGGGEDNIFDLMTPRRATHGTANAEAYAATNLFMKNGVQCADLITSGVLARFPELRFVSVESGIGWIPFVLECADYSFLGASTAARQGSSDLLPSELFRRQVYSTFWFEHVAPTRLLDELPVDNLLFETDFPHVTCLYGNIAETIEANLGHMSEQVRRKVLWDNAAALYGVEAPAEADRARMAAA